MVREIPTKLVGVTKENDYGYDIQDILDQINLDYREGDTISLEHELDNEHDKNAIKVYYDGDHIGYINRELAAELAPLVDQGKVEAELAEITGGKRGKCYGCNIVIKVSDYGFPRSLAATTASVSASEPAQKREAYIPHTYSPPHYSHTPPARSTKRLICPKCRSYHISVQAIQQTELKNKHHSLVWWLFIGWWWVFVKWLFFTIPALIIKIFAPKKQVLKQEIKSICVCQDCGYQWEAEQDEEEVDLILRIFPEGSWREKLLFVFCGLTSFSLTIYILAKLFA